VLPPQKTDGKGDLRTEKGRYMGVGKAGILFLPDGGRTIVERKSVTLVESHLPLCGNVAAPAEAVSLQPPVPQWPVELHDPDAPQVPPDPINEQAPSEDNAQVEIAPPEAESPSRYSGPPSRTPSGSPSGS
jgi:hypothetical protein